MYPIEKYKFYQTKTADGCQKIIAVATYAGKTVRGVAICHPSDTFDLEIGKEIAAARCAVKVSERRLKRAERKHNEADNMVDQACYYADRMAEYEWDAEDALSDAEAHLNDLLAKAGVKIL